VRLARVQNRGRIHIGVGVLEKYGSIDQAIAFFQKSISPKVLSARWWHICQMKGIEVSYRMTVRKIFLVQRFGQRIEKTRKFGIFFFGFSSITLLHLHLKF